MISSYLCTIANSAAELGRVVDSEAMEEQATVVVASPEESPDALLDKIAHHLLAASNPSVLALESDHLPSLATEESTPLLVEEENQVKQNQQDDIYQYRRSDYLRRLLRAMAPISFDVSARICSTVLSAEETSVRGPKIWSAVVLFSHWLSVAPHLSAMIIDFLKAADIPSYPWNVNDTDDDSMSTTIREEFVTIEAIYQLCSFFHKQGDSYILKDFWDWSFVYQLLGQRDEEMGEEDPSLSSSAASFHLTGIRWFAARIMTILLNWKPAVMAAFLQRLDIQTSRPTWVIHQWITDEEEEVFQHLLLDSKTRLWGKEPIPLPSVNELRSCISLHPWLVLTGKLTVFYKQLSILEDKEDMIVETRSLQEIHSERLIATSTTSRNLSLLGAALCQQPYPPPILVCGPHGSGKSSLVRELVNLCSPLKSLLEIHVDEETDSKTLIGSYTATDIPGEFAWRPGALTCATREGRWVLLEDLDAIPVEIQASLVKLFEERLLPLGNGKYEKCHPNFRIFGTCTTSRLSPEQSSSGCLRIGSHRGSGKKILNPSLWRKVHVEPLPFEELKEISQSLYQNIPEHVIDTALQLQKQLDSSGRITNTIDGQDTEVDGQAGGDEPLGTTGVRSHWTGRSPSVRDFFKVLSRIQNSVSFERNTTYSTEAQRTLCLAECIDIFAGSCSDRSQRREFIANIAAPVWKISSDLALSYSEKRRPEILVGRDCTNIGRANIKVTDHHTLKREVSENFAQTSYSLRLMESIGVCVRQNEPILLVGETGGGKTTLVQQLAGYCERELIVQNLSLQTDSTDLLGGYRPLEIHHVARHVYREFVDLFVSTFSRKQNAQFLEFASTAHEKKQWKKLSQCFTRAAQLGLSKVKERSITGESIDSQKWKYSLAAWQRFEDLAKKFERQRVACDAGMAFVFTEGALIDAIRYGKWVLLDEINLAASDTLQRLCGLLDDPRGSVTLTERGDSVAVERHPNFRLFAAMNPATDAGKKDLPASIRSRFSELYVDELLDPIELRLVSSRYIEAVLPKDGKEPEHSDTIVSSVNVYLRCRELAESALVDGGGHKPRYTLRSLSRALSAAKNLVISQRLPLRRAIYEGFQLSFEGALEPQSTKLVRKALKQLLDADLKKHEMDHPGRKPGGRNNSSDYVLIKPFWIQTGPLEPVDWSEATSDGRSRFILTPSTSSNLRKLARTLAAGPWPVLLEGPTSAGKTTLVEYIAARAGHHVVRINNHEHTDVQEYTGSFSADQNGTLSFRDGILVRALKRGHWVILDELNLAPSEVLEALNRLLDDNRELYIAETNETVKPHPDFRLFATQNPCGAYGGRKPLSRAFRNRFVEIHMGDIPSQEMITILEKRCGSPPSHAKKLVDVMITLRQRRSRSGVFLGKDSFITPRDLLRWAGRGANSTQELAQEGYMLLAERLRTSEEKSVVAQVIGDQFKTKLNMDDIYFGENSEARKLLASLIEEDQAKEQFLLSMAPTNSFLRLICLVLRCIKKKEPVLLVGETGCGKTTVIQFLSMVFKQDLHALNCHATTETSDLIGGLRPVRGRDSIAHELLSKVKDLYSRWPFREALKDILIPDSISSLLQDGGVSNEPSSSLGSDIVTELVRFARNIVETKPTGEGQSSQERAQKRLKKSPGYEDSSDAMSSLLSLHESIERLGKSHAALFEWSDGPLVKAMKRGDMMLLDEMSLAEDAVLERLNSVLEPSRTLVLAEKGDDGSEREEESRVLEAHENFRIFATMNPGGDFGKRELSPALRSRFTEIWVPAITERRDFELVLSRCFQSISGDDVEIRGRMLDYVFWFNETIAGDAQSPCSGLTLTLRDILSWARFVIHSQCDEKPMSKWDAFCHGARLMHLDGLGLGAGLSLEDAAEAQHKAENYLKALVPNDNQLLCFEQKIDIVAEPATGRFGCIPFYVPLGPLGVEDASFDMASPTTSLNIYRVLRAMHLARPIILEGPPGVGKTSLVTALAKASGHKLVRINLSEQTDITDLMGSDLPVQDSESSEASFKWCDGVLLTAIKEGSWVLLDELNLASQSVLEGLNSCLDHRASVYIPELGKTFDCPKTFRVFAAQNPLGQGGGRKGLPKSFLNRFTKVYVNSLTDKDFQSIVSSRFPSLDTRTVNKMIVFNQRVHSEVEEKKSFGHSGSPWEFNLRDVFRWCDLIISSEVYDHSHARDLYIQRFRSQEDRVKLDAIYAEIFGSSTLALGAPVMKVKENSVQIGNTQLQRRPVDDISKFQALQREPEVLFSLREPTEAVARCVSLGWPCLIVGPSGSGKSSIIKSLAEMCNETVVEQCLSPSSDVTELIGCFEQLDSGADEQKILEDLLLVCHEALFSRSIHDKSMDRVWVLSSKLESAKSLSLSEKKSSVFPVVNDLCEILQELMSHNKSFEIKSGSLFQSIVSRVRDLQHRETDEKSSHFVWKDGVLVEAMKYGHWLHLENVNLCPASVLDRLNSVMERGGFLLLSECGNQDDEASGYQIIRPHPNFRVFLSMNPLHGEISRAMRNRCVEVAMLSTVKNDQADAGALHGDGSNIFDIFNQDVILDSLSVTRAGGLRSFQQLACLLRSFVRENDVSKKHGLELPCISNISSSALLFAGLAARGLPAEECLSSMLQLGMEITERQALSYTDKEGFKTLSINQSVSLPFGLSLRADLAMDCDAAGYTWRSRVLRVYMDDKIALLSEVLSKYILCQGSLAPTVYPEFFDSKSGISPFDQNLLDYVIAVYVDNSITSGSNGDQVKYFGGMDSACARKIKEVATKLESWNITHSKDFLQAQSTGEPSAANTNGDSETVHRSLVRGIIDYLIHRLREDEWTTATSVQDMSEAVDTSVLQASWYIKEGRLDRASISCPVTPTLCPLFLAFDHWLDLLVLDSDSFIAVVEDKVLNSTFQDLMRLRALMWDTLRVCSFSSKSSGFLGFEESEFLVLWRWFNKSIETMTKRISTTAHGLRAGLTPLLSITDGINYTIYGGSFQTNACGLFRKNMNKPCVPQKKEQWRALHQLKGLSKELSIFDGRFEALHSQNEILSLPKLVELCHPSLFIPFEQRSDVLAALCTGYWSVVNEMGGKQRTTEGLSLSTNAFNSLRALFSQKRDEFSKTIASVKVDTSIETVENQLDVAKLEQFRESHDSFHGESAKYKDFSSSLLLTYGRLQLSSMVEFWSMHEEKSLIDSIRGILLAKLGENAVRQEVLKLVPRLEKYVVAVASKSFRDIIDLRPYQTLIWALEKSNAPEESFISLLKGLLTTMAHTYSQRIWKNSFTNLSLIDAKMEMPTLWVDDLATKPGHATNQTEQVSEYCGPVRLEHQVRSEVAFRLLGEHFTWHGGTKRTDLCTMENYRSRRSQMADMLDHLSTLNIQKSEIGPVDVQYYVYEFLQAARKSFPDQAAEELLRLARMPSLFSETPLSDMRKLLDMTSNATIKASMDDLVVPLFSSLQCLWKDFSSSVREGQYALALIYIGLLRLLALSPDSPLDPGRAPLSKVALLDQKLDIIRKKFGAIRLDRCFVQGDFTLECDTAQEVLGYGGQLLSKRSSQEKKIIERSDDAPQFFDLFREVRDFVQGLGRKEMVLELCRAIRQCQDSAGESFRKLKQRELNWQSTSSAFCNLIDQNYAPYYEEITTNVIESVRSVQNGLRLLLNSKAEEAPGTSIPEAFKQLMRYPIRPSTKSTSHLVSAIIGMALSTGDGVETRCQQAAALAVLTRFSLQARVHGLRNDLVCKTTAILNTITNSHVSILQNVDDADEPKTEEEAREKEFQEQFPDHFKEFNSFLQSLGDEDTDDSELVHELEGLSKDMGMLSEEQISLVCTIHREMFGGRQAPAVDDALRTRAFVTGYGAAFSLAKAYDLSRKWKSSDEQLTCHAMGLLTALRPRKTLFGSTIEASGSEEFSIDFHNDPNPLEATNAAEPLEHLMTRTAQLLTAFPGHPILLALGTLCEKVRKFDLLTTPVGRVMAGLEVILKQAQEWEQHASERVKLGKPLQEVSQLVARWRRLQLQSWSRLMDTREHRFVMRARRHFIRLNNILHEDNGAATEENENAAQQRSLEIFTGPSSSYIDLVSNWIWKGMGSNYSHIPPLKDSSKMDDVSELIQVLDTFILTSPLGEFEERMEILRSFSLQLRKEIFSRPGEASSWRLQQYRALSSIWFYYMQFFDHISSHLAHLREPIEKRLKDEVKLARWDEQSYFSLADSTEKNHRKLMKILGLFDDVLDQNVGLLIQQQSCKGIRSQVDAHDEFCGSMPDKQSMFPLSTEGLVAKKELLKKVLHRPLDDLSESYEWTDTTNLDLLGSVRIPRLSKFAVKMKSICNDLSMPHSSWVNSGTVLSSELCDAIFARIDSLRKDSTRPMKERALVDLFRELKRNGFSPMKWSTPHEIRQMKALLQLPLPIDEAKQSDENVAAAERYFTRCINELNSLRSETNMLGSKHMTRQQTTAMVHYGEHGLLMLVQQRVILADSLVEKKRLEVLSRVIDSGKSAPPNQVELKQAVQRFQHSFCCTKEGLRQISLLLKLSQTMLNNPSKAEWARDTITKLESRISDLDQYTISSTPGMVSQSQLQSLSLMRNTLLEIEDDVMASMEKCASLGCIPADAFDSLLCDIRDAIAAGNACTSSSKNVTTPMATDDTAWSDLLSAVNQSIDSALITAQGFASSCKEKKGSDGADGSSDMDADGSSSSIMECHRESAKEWGSVNLRKLNTSFENTIAKLVGLLEEVNPDSEKSLKSIGIVSDVGMLLRNISSMTERRLEDYAAQYKSTSKLIYVLLRVFRVLVSQGFCSDKESDDQDGDADGDVSGMNFDDDNDGTGMGEGEGKNDVTDQLENEEQLLGLKGDDQNENDEPQESKELDKEQAEQGMEMEGDFEGEMYDLPEQPQDENNDEQEDDGEELEREMNDEGSPNEEVVDEKMWDDEDNDEDNGKEEEKFEKDSKTQGEAIEGETRTKDPEEEEDTSKENDKKDQEAQAEPKPESGESGDVEDAPDEMDINEDADEKYEEKHGVDVRDDEGDEKADQEDEMDLDENLDLDDAGAEDDQSDGDPDAEATEQEVEGEENVDLNDAEQEVAENDDDAEAQDEDTDSVENAAVPTGAGATENDDQPQQEEDQPGEEDENPLDVPATQESTPQETHGVRAQDGQDAVLQDEDDEMEDVEGENEGEKQDAGGSGSSQMEPSRGMGGDGVGENNNSSEEVENSRNPDERPIAPNPFKNPGDASKFWHKKLNMVDTEPDPDPEAQSEEMDQDDSQSNNGGEYEYNPSEQEGATQVLGETTEEEAIGLEQDQHEQKQEEDNDSPCPDDDSKPQTENQERSKETNSRSKKSDKPTNSIQNQDDDPYEPQDDNPEAIDLPEQDEQIQEDENSTSMVDSTQETARENLVVSDASKLGARDSGHLPRSDQFIEEDFAEGMANISLAEARTKWLSIQADTHSLARRLCEKLRLVMEPLVASKLRGDYRTGKRINMKRVIGYIASGYRKDKIWLRRTKPAKRNYRVLLAVDDSESMAKSGAGEMALRAMATLAVGMNQLEIGEVGVASFGNEMRLVHPFHLPFTSESGVNAVQHFEFDQKRTRTALCVESAMAALDTTGDVSSMQLVFMISDGRIERDSRAELKRLIREMFERNILLAMIVVEGQNSDGSRKDSLVNMKEVTFEKGKPVVKRFIEDYPFPYYIILEDMSALPEVLGDALRQWFEMLAQMQNTS